MNPRTLWERVGVRGWLEGSTGLRVEKLLPLEPLTRPPSLRCAQLWRPTSPTASRACPTCAPWCRTRASPGPVGEVDYACCAVSALQRLRPLYQAFLSPGARFESDSTVATCASREYRAGTKILADHPIYDPGRHS